MPQPHIEMWRPRQRNANRIVRRQRRNEVRIGSPRRGLHRVRNHNQRLGSRTHANRKLASPRRNEHLRLGESCSRLVFERRSPRPIDRNKSRQRKRRKSATARRPRKSLQRSRDRSKSLLRNRKNRSKTRNRTHNHSLRRARASVGHDSLCVLYGARRIFILCRPADGNQKQGACSRALRFWT